MADERDRLSEILPRYELGGELGRGAWGIVWEAEHRTLERRVAVKYLPGAFRADPRARERFRAEARVVASLDHPHIVPVFDFIEHDEMCVFVMELMAGGTLGDRAERDELSAEAICGIGIAVVAALGHAHQRGVLHRDVKPENVLFNAHGRPKLADFGIAKVLGAGADSRTATGMIMGTPAYMAPEQGTGETVGPATDIYAVGVMLYELFAGRLPIESTGDPLAQLYRRVNEPSPPLQDVAASVPQPVAAVVMRALETAPADRYADAAAFVSALSSAASAALGSDWLARSEIPVLAGRTVVEDTEPGRHEAQVSQAPPPPAGAPPPPPAQSATTGGPPPPPAPQSTAPSKSRRPLLWLASGLLLILVPIVIGVALALPLGDDADDADGPASEADAESEATEPASEMTAAAAERFREACRLNNVRTELCECALERSLDELTTEQFLENDLLLRETGDGLTQEVEAQFAACQAEL